MSSVATSRKVDLQVEGMTCSNCALGISRYLEKQGLEEVDVSFPNSEVRFRLDNNNELPDVIKGIEKLGYQVIGENGQGKIKGSWFTIERKFWFSVIWTVPLFLHMFLPQDNLLNDPWIQLALCIPVFAIGIWHFGKSGWYSLKTGIPNMDVLITIGSGAAFIYSLIGTINELGNDYLYYETSAMIITLVLLGNLIEYKSVKQTTTAIKDLGRLQVKKAKIVDLLSQDGEGYTFIDTQKIQVGQLLLVNTGDQVPVDGHISWGNATIDESMITGESLPASKQKGDKVIGGTLLQSGSIHLQATAVGQDTTLSKIIEVVKEAQSNKPEIQKLADKVSAIFVPVVLAVSLLTFIIAAVVVGLSYQASMLNAIAVLVIACPCAMGLATPTAVMVGVGRAARNGILFKGSANVEIFSKIKQVVFDKTGTLTTGNFKIKKVHILEYEEEQILSWLLSLEQHSSHPIARSLVKELKDKYTAVKFNEVEELKGKGVTSKDDEGNTYSAGSWMIAPDIIKNKSHNVYLLRNNQLVAALDLSDEIKEDAKDCINYLHSQGIKTILLSGDQQERCEQVAGELGIKEVYGEKRPEEKLEIISKLTNEEPTAMVGDGINDAPALARATIGISLSDATEVAINSAQVILLKGKLNYLKKAFSTSKHTLITIKQNLFWAFFYNALAIPVAAVGLLSPMIAALSMAFSDVIVIGNSIRLKSKSIDS